MTSTYEDVLIAFAADGSIKAIAAVKHIAWDADGPERLWGGQKRKSSSCSQQRQQWCYK